MTESHNHDVPPPSSGGGFSDDDLLAEMREVYREDLEDAGVSADPSPVPNLIGGYQISGLLGHGGMGVVYEAEQQSPRRKVALKVVRGGSFVDAHRLRLFHREAQTLARMKHAGIAAIFESGRTEHGEHFFAMELIRGAPLHEFVLDHDLPLRKRLELFVEICDAVNYAHQRGVIHRDLKPSNIMVDGGGKPKVLDFGLAKITDADVNATTLVTDVGRIQGTLAYMSPEQARGNPDEIDLRTDVYALGVILFELVTDQLPYDVSHTVLHEATRVICEVAPIRPSALRQSVRGDLETITLKSLEKEPERRYQNAAALGDDVRRLLTDQPIHARPPSTSYHLRKVIARHKLPFAILAILVLTVFVFGIWMSVLYSSEQHQRSLAQAAQEHAADEALAANNVALFLIDLFKKSDPNEALGRDMTVRDALDRGFEQIQLRLDDEPHVRARLMHTLGEVGLELGLLEKSEAMLESALQLRTQLHPNAHVDVAATLDMMGRLHREQGEYDDAENFFHRAIDVSTTAIGANSTAVARHRMQLATVLVALNEYKDAELLLLEVEPVFRGTDDVDGNELADLLDLVGLVIRQGRGDDREAMRYYREALGMRRTLYGERPHPDLAVSLINVARVQLTTGEYSEAEASFREALAIREEVFDTAHPKIVRSLRNLAFVLASQEKHDEAEATYRRALDLIDRSSVPDRRMQSANLDGLAQVLTAKSEALDTRGDDTQKIAVLDEAVALSQKALEIRVELFGDHHRAVAASHYSLSRLLMTAGRNDEALDEATGALSIWKTVHTGAHPEIAFGLMGVARVHREREEWSEAAAWFRKALEMRRERHGNEHHQTAASASELGESLARLGEFEEARELVTSAVPIICAKRGPAHSLTKAAIQRVVTVHTLAGHPELAARFEGSAACDGG